MCPMSSGLQLPFTNLSVWENPHRIICLCFLISLFLCWNGSPFMLVHACGPEPSVFFQSIDFFDLIHFILFAISLLVI